MYARMYEHVHMDTYGQRRIFSGGGWNFPFGFCVQRQYLSYGKWLLFSPLKSMFLSLSPSKSISISLAVFFCLYISLSLSFFSFLFLFAFFPFPLLFPFLLFFPCCHLFCVRRQGHPGKARKARKARQICFCLWTPLLQLVSALSIPLPTADRAPFSPLFPRSLARPLRCIPLFPPSFSPSDLATF